MSKTDLTRRTALTAMAASTAAACSPRRSKPVKYDGNVAFRHGVASGDPRADAIVIWTRVSPDREGPVPVRWIVASDRRMSRIVASGDVITDSAHDYTVKADAQKLKPGHTYYYAFIVNDTKSIIGKTKTLPKGSLTKLTIAAVSCSNYPFGFFNVYEEISSRAKDIDLIVHLGDYIYEYGLGGYGSETGLQLGRTPEPAVECVTLADYRGRHAQYKTDPDLQSAHAVMPWIVTWDDHEVCNDAWSGGAENHSPQNGEGDYAERKRAAMQAYYEWMPIRDPVPGKALEASNRSFQFGDLFTLLTLETRLMARSQQLDPAVDLKLVSTAWDFANPTAPTIIPPGQPAGVTARLIPTPFDMSGAAPRPITDWRVVSTIDPRNPPPNIKFLPDIEEFKKRVADPSRALLGAAQEKWIDDTLVAGKKARSVWSVFANQVLMARIDLAPKASLDPVFKATIEKEYPLISAGMDLNAAGVPALADSWDGYPAQRDRLYKILEQNDANVIVLTGDSHSAWASELHAADGKRIGDEFGVTSVTSPSIAESLNPGKKIDMAKLLVGKEVKWHDHYDHGFTLLTLTKKQARAEFVRVTSVTSKDYKAETVATFTVLPEKGPTVGGLTKTA